MVILYCSLWPDTSVFGILDGNFLWHFDTFLLIVALTYFIRDLVTSLHLLVGTLLHRGVGTLRTSVGLLTLLLIDRGADWLPVVVAHLVVLSVADTLRDFAAVVVVFRLIPKVFVEFFYFAFFYRLADWLSYMCLVAFGLWDIFTSFFGDSLADRNLFLHAVLNRDFFTGLLFVCGLTGLRIDCVAIVTVLVVTVQHLCGLAFLAVNHIASLLCVVLTSLDIKFSTLILTKYIVYMSPQVVENILNANDWFL